MALWQGRSRRKPTGGRYRPIRKKRKFEIGREQQYAFVGSQKMKYYRTRGRNQKVRILQAEFANVIDPKTGKTARSKIVTVKENSSNPHFVTRNIITRGAVVQTEAGLAKVTSQPGQDGVINAVLVAGTAAPTTPAPPAPRKVEKAAPAPAKPAAKPAEPPARATPRTS